MSDARNATPAETFERRIMDPCIPKSEAEHWAAREIEKQRAEIERLRAVYVLIVSEEAGPVDSATYWYEERIVGCYSSRDAADRAGADLKRDSWRIEEHPLIRNTLEGKP